jgi:hypothetical protein
VSDTHAVSNVAGMFAPGGWFTWDSEDLLLDR